MTATESILTRRIEGRILVVDPDLRIFEMIQSHFGHDGFVVDSCRSTDEFYSVDIADYNLMVIDLNIDDNSGMDIVEQIKQRRDTARMGVIACAVNMSPASIINALNSGADDYLIKPFSVRELMARVRAVLRRQI